MFSWKRYIPALLAFGFGALCIEHPKVAVIIVSGISFTFGFFYLFMIQSMNKAKFLFMKYNRMYQDGKTTWEYTAKTNANFHDVDVEIIKPVIPPVVELGASKDLHP